ncbi:MAG: hypothetical protein NTW87_11210 [Planctomycetota bacterium]|nr:hypothetical protein [Planctomycetota bacterium]
MARSAKDIADMLERLQQYYAAVSTALVLLNDDDVLRLLQAKGYDLGSTIRLGRRDNSYYEGIKLWNAIHSVRRNAGFNLDFLGILFMTSLSWVGDELTKNGYFDETPELELFRHLRNGISHGNTFNLLKGEPRRPAKFKGFEITPALHGQGVLFEFMSTGDLFDLFDHVKAHLRSLP